MGGDSCSRGRDFESQCRIGTGRIIFTFICCKNCFDVWKEQKYIKKRPGMADFLKICFNLHCMPIWHLFRLFSFFDWCFLKKMRTFDISGIWTKIFGVEGECDDHLSTSSVLSFYIWYKSKTIMQILRTHTCRVPVVFIWTGETILRLIETWRNPLGCLQ